MKKILTKIFFKLQTILFGRLIQELIRLNEKNSLQNLIDDNSAKEVFLTFKEEFKKKILINDANSDSAREKMIKYNLSKIDYSKLRNDNKQYAILEFGVHKGNSINIIGKYIKDIKDLDITIFGFDTFYGLTEDWVGNYQPQGSLDLKGNLPKVQDNTKLIPGKIQETLVPFLKTINSKILFVNIDVDTYETTKFILRNIKDHIDKGTIINFDDFYNFPGWQNGEYKALIEELDKSKYEYLAFATKKGHVSIIIV